MKRPILINSPYILPDLCPSHWVSSFRIFYHLCPPAPPPRRSRSARRAPEPPGPRGSGGSFFLGSPCESRGREAGGSFQLLLCSTPPFPTYTPFSTGFSALCRKPPRRVPASPPRESWREPLGVPGRLLLAPLRLSGPAPGSRRPSVPPGHPPPRLPGPARRGGAPAGGGRSSQANSGATRCGLAPSPTASASPSDSGWVGRGPGKGGGNKKR